MKYSIKELWQIIKELFCKHRWEPYGIGQNPICEKCNALQSEAIIIREEKEGNLYDSLPYEESDFF